MVRINKKRKRLILFGTTASMGHMSFKEIERAFGTTATRKIMPYKLDSIRRNQKL